MDFADIFLTSAAHNMHFTVLWQAELTSLPLPCSTWGSSWGGSSLTLLCRGYAFSFEYVDFQVIFPTAPVTPSFFPLTRHSCRVDIVPHHKGIL